MSPSFPLLPDPMVKKLPSRSLQAPSSPPFLGIVLGLLRLGNLSPCPPFHRHRVLHGQHEFGEPSEDVTCNVTINFVQSLYTAVLLGRVCTFLGGRTSHIDTDFLHLSRRSMIHEYLPNPIGPPSRAWIQLDHSCALVTLLGPFLCTYMYA
jgi:hypothetical protein